MLIYATKVWDKKFLLTEMAIHNLWLLIMRRSCYCVLIGLRRRISSYFFLRERDERLVQRYAKPISQPLRDEEISLV